MKKIIFLLIGLFLFIILKSMGMAAPDEQLWAKTNPYIIGVPSVVGPSYLAIENFDGSSDCYPGDVSNQNCNETWNADLMNDWNCDAGCNAGAPLEGTYSALHDRADINGPYIDFGAEQQAVWAFFMFKTTTWVDGGYFVMLRNDADSSICEIRVDASQNIYVRDEDGKTGADVAIAAGTLYYTWLEFDRKTGSGDGICNLYVSTTTTRGAVDSTITNGDLSDGVDRVRFISEAGDIDYILDKIRVDDEAIGDNPS